MRMYLGRSLRAVTAAVLCLQFYACGTILYPERRNKEPGRLDVGVVLLDGFWLFFGIIPGVIAFAVDFSTGAIYVPERGDYSKLRTIPFDPETTSRTELEALISLETGEPFRFSDKRVQYTRVKDKEEAGAYFAGLKP